MLLSPPWHQFPESRPVKGQSKDLDWVNFGSTRGAAAKNMVTSRGVVLCSKPRHHTARAETSLFQPPTQNMAGNGWQGTAHLSLARLAIASIWQNSGPVRAVASRFLPLAKHRPFWRFTMLRSQWTGAADHGSAAGVRSRQRKGWTTALNSYERRQYRLAIPEHEHRWPVYLRSWCVSRQRLDFCGHGNHSGNSCCLLIDRLPYHSRLPARLCRTIIAARDSLNIMKRCERCLQVTSPNRCPKICWFLPS